MAYKVIVTKMAKYQLDQMLRYIQYKLKNPDAARNVRRDVNETKRKLTYLAESIKLCDEPELAMRGYRIIFLQKHNYFMLYRVDGNIVYIDAIFHGLQNYQNIFK